MTERQRERRETVTWLTFSMITVQKGTSMPHNVATLCSDLWFHFDTKQRESRLRCLVTLITVTPEIMYNLLTPYGQVRFARYRDKNGSPVSSRIFQSSLLPVNITITWSTRNWFVRCNQGPTKFWTGGTGSQLARGPPPPLLLNFGITSVAERGRRERHIRLA